MAASLMTAMDFLIEPVAIRAGWWWSAGDIPISNYVTWWIVAFALGLLWRDEDDLNKSIVRLVGCRICPFYRTFEFVVMDTVSFSIAFLWSF